MQMASLYETRDGPKVAIRFTDGGGIQVLSPAEGQQLLKELTETLALLTPATTDGASALPEFIQEALNSGDGTYRP
jgi:uncharacterized protein (DUF58 family)